MQHNAKLTPRAQKLSREMTKEERRQVAFGNYILDFYCAAAKLAIELDGSKHYEEHGLRYDMRRDAYLNGSGIYVLHFSNTDILQNLRGVCHVIDMTVAQRVR